MCVLEDLMDEIEYLKEFNALEEDFVKKQQRKQNIERSKLTSKNDLKRFLKEERKAKTDRWMAGRFRL
jgi:hypothetical protein